MRKKLNTVAPSGIPLVKELDVIVIGGSTPGVAAACAAAEEGAKVFLACPESYLGEDICATGRLWLPEPETTLHPLASELFSDKNGGTSPFIRPMEVKGKLDAALLKTGVDFLFASHPADLLIGDDGAVAGVVLTGKCGPYAIGAPVVIDSTPMAAMARAAGVPFTQWNGGSLQFTRTVIGHRAENPGGCAEKQLPDIRWQEYRTGDITCSAYEYTCELKLDAWSQEVLAEAEHIMRERTWHPDQVWSSDRCYVNPPVRIDPGGGATGNSSQSSPADDGWAASPPGLYVLGPCAPISGNDPEAFKHAPSAIQTGDRLGRKIAAGIKNSRRTPASAIRPMHQQRYEGAGSICEPASSPRFDVDTPDRIPGPAGMNLPLLGEFDVVVAGGGTGGAPAAIAAARTGAGVLLLESLHALGGIGTLGYITRYYHGYRGGFTGEMTAAMKKLAEDDKGFDPDEWNAEHKSEWLRKELIKAGGKIWYGSTVSGALMEGNRIRGVVVNTPLGRGLIKAGAVIDATGNADVAAAAGAQCRMTGDFDLAVQGSGLAPRPLVPKYFNTDYTFIDDSDPVDVTRAFVTSRRKFKEAFDSSQIPDTRERRQIIGDVTLTPLHAYMGATWHDTVCLGRSNFDSHGFTVHPLFFVQPPDRKSLDVWLPLRALLPAGIEGMLVTGLALSAHRDVMPTLRMQPDVQNHSFAAGMAAAESAKKNTPLREIDVRQLQRRLVDIAILPASVLLHEDSRDAAENVCISAAGGELKHHSELAVLMSRPEDAMVLLRKRLAIEQDSETKIRCAKLLAFMGDNAGEDILVEAAGADEWDKGWNFRGMGQFGRSMSPTDDCIAALARLRSQKAHSILLEKAGRLGESDAFSHYRAISLYAEAAGGNEWASLLRELLEKPGISGFSLNSCREALVDIPSDWNDNSTRNSSLRELYLARALYRCGDSDGVGEDILRRYSRDIRGHYARHAAAILDS